MTKNLRTMQAAAIAAIFSATLLTGCKTKEQKAVDDAKTQAAATGVSQQVQYVDANGDTVTTTVTPPQAGQPQQVSTNIAPPPPGPRPARTSPVITPVGQAAPPATPAAQLAATAPAVQPTTPTVTDNVPPANQTADTTATNAPHVDISIPAGTTLAVRINQHISVKHAHAGDRFSGEIVEPISVNNSVVIPKGTPVSGRIDEAHRRGHFKGASVLELRLTSLELNGSRYALDTHDNVRTKKGKGKRSTAFIGGLTGAGMLIGGIASGGVGLAIGAASGAGAGTLLAGTTGNRDIEIPAESIVRFRLADSLVVQNAQ